MGLIEIENMEFHAYHGHFEAEQVVGNRFLVNVALKTNCQPAAQSDDLNDALNYQEVYLLIKKEMEQPSKLLENVADRILTALYQQHETLDWARIKISKMNPPMGGQIERVSVTLER